MYNYLYALTPQNQGLYWLFAIFAQANFTGIFKFVIFIWILYLGKWDWINRRKSNLNILAKKYVSIWHHKVSFLQKVTWEKWKANENTKFKNEYPYFFSFF